MQTKHSPSIPSPGVLVIHVVCPSGTEVLSAVPVADTAHAFAFALAAHGW